MARNNESPTQINYRPAQPEDAHLASRLIFDSFPKMATFVFGLGDAQRAKAILTGLFSQPGHRFSYQFTDIATQGGQAVGLFLAYPGKGQFWLNYHFARLLIKQYHLIEKIKLIRRSLPMAFVQEAARDEYLLANLAVKKGRRNQGIGAQILSHVEEKAQQAGCQRVSLIVTLDNQKVRCFYERHGYKIKAIHPETNQRAGHLGPGYQRMVKELK